jgi:hypothetical protein
VLEHDPPVKAKTIANGERRIASSEWFFWRARFLPCRKILGTFSSQPTKEAWAKLRPNLIARGEHW